MSTALTKTENGGAAVAVAGRLTREQTELLKRTICKGATDDELALFLEVCKLKKLDPFSKQIYAVKRYDMQTRGEVMAYQTSIQGMRAIADRTGERNGQDAPLWCGEDGVWREVWLSPKPPAAAKVTVYRKGHAKPYTGIAQHAFYVQTKRDGTPVAMWAKGGGAHMLAKCAEALALSMAFPEETSGLHVEETMHQADSEYIDVAPGDEFQAPPAQAEALQFDAERYDSLMADIVSASNRDEVSALRKASADFEPWPEAFTALKTACVDRWKEVE